MNEKFIERIKELQKEQNLNYAQLAKIVNCSKGAMSNYVCGRRFPNISIFVKMADCFSCSTDYLYGSTDFYEEKEFVPCPPFSQRVKFLIKHFKITQIELITGADITDKMFYYWANDRSQPSPESVYKIAKYLSCSMDFVIGRESDKSYE